jgi:uncharacterized protein with FMN-binding domain
MHLQNEEQTTEMTTIRKSGATEYARGNYTASDDISLAVARVTVVALLEQWLRFCFWRATG